MYLDNGQENGNYPVLFGLRFSLGSLDQGSIVFCYRFEVRGSGFKV